MKLALIGIGNPDPTVGAFRSNTAGLIEMGRAMADKNCTLACFPEQSISGYPVEDLVLWKKFIAGQWEQLLRFAQETAHLKTVFILGLAVEYGANAYNCAAVVHQGIILGLVPKEKLPTYGVFYEERTYAHGFPGLYALVNGVPFGDLVFNFPFGTIAVEVCEDIWSPDGPLRRRCYNLAETIINLSASPYRAGVLYTRRELIATRASDNLATVIYANQFGGNDALAFDGGGFVNQCGRMIYEAPRWREGFGTATVDLDRASRQRRENTTWRRDRELYLRNEQPCHVVKTERETVVDLDEYPYPAPANRSFFIPADAPLPSPRDEFFNDSVMAATTALDGYYRKTKAFKRIGIALSGGRDSILTLLLAYNYATKVRKLSGAELKDFIWCFSFPTKHNSKKTRNISRRLCKELGVTFVEIPIGREFERAKALVQAMLPPGQPIGKLALQNMQARIRGKLMWDWSNNTGGLWIQTGNMSEKAVGYTTIGGDMMGAYSLLGNLPKTVIIALIEYLDASVYHSKALKLLATTRSSAELEAGQADEDDLMPFPILDSCFALFVGEKMTPSEVLRVIKQMFSEYPAEQLRQWVVRFVNLFRAAIFKWVQTPHAVHMGTLDLDYKRALQLPVATSAEWLELEPLQITQAA